MYKRDDEWGIIIKKQVEQDQARSNLERLQHKLQQEEYKKQLDSLLSIKHQQKQSKVQEKSQDLTQIHSQIQFQSHEQEAKRQQKLEEYKKLVEDNLKLQAYSLSQKAKEKNLLLELEKQNNSLDRSKYLDSINQYKSHKKSIEQEMARNLKFSQDRQEIRKKIEFEAKEKESQLAKQEELRFIARDQEYKSHLNKIKENQMKKMEVFSINIAPKLVEKELDYERWVKHAEEERRNEEMRKMMEIERRKEIEAKVVARTLKKQSEDKEIMKVLRKDEERAVDDELQRRIEFSMRIDEDRNLRKKVDVLSYREELLQQAEFDKIRKKNEFKLSEREKSYNKSLLEEKNLLVRGANEIIRPSEGINKRTPGMSPSLKSTTLQLSNLPPY